MVMEQNCFTTAKLKVILLMILAYFTALAILHYLFILQYQLSTPPKGFCSSQFKAVAKVFRLIFFN